MSPAPVSGSGPSAWWAVAAGGALGALARHLVLVQLTARWERVAPFGVLGVNVVGCFAIGLLWAWMDRAGVDRAGAEPAWLRPLLMTGFLGGFTTYSAFGKDTVEAFVDGRSLVAILNVLAHVVFGLLAVVLGRALVSVPAG